MTSLHTLVRQLGLTLLLSLPAICGAQQYDPPSPSYTFHIQTDILQIPVLVLSENKLSLPPIDPSRFTVSIAGGAPFHPKVRREGNDPIALAIVADHSGPQQALLSPLPAAISQAMPTLLTNSDTIRVDSLNHCLLRHIIAPSQPGAAAQQRLLDRSAATYTLADEHDRQTRCDPTVKLWDTLAITIAELAKQPGRRILLVVSNGNDTGSHYTWNQVRLFAVTDAVTIFSLSDPQDPWRRKLHTPSSAEADGLPSLCQLTGGMNLESTPATLDDFLRSFVSLVRNRYIVEFPRPQHFTNSATLDVQLKGMRAVIRPSGISFPKRTEETPSDSTATRSQARPIPGDRVALPPPQLITPSSHEQTFARDVSLPTLLASRSATASCRLRLLQRVPSRTPRTCPASPLPQTSQPSPGRPDCPPHL